MIKVWIRHTVAEFAVNNIFSNVINNFIQRSNTLRPAFAQQISHARYMTKEDVASIMKAPFTATKHTGYYQQGDMMIYFAERVDHQIRIRHTAVRYLDEIEKYYELDDKGLTDTTPMLKRKS
jgi:hypothetical protein